MDKQIIFAHGITSITVRPKKPFNGYRVVENYKHEVGTRFLVFPRYEIVPKAVIYDFYFDAYEGTVDEFNQREKWAYVENDVVYENPHCVISMNNDRDRVVYCETLDELNEYVQRITAFGPHITLNID